MISDATDQADITRNPRTHAAVLRFLVMRLGAAIALLLVISVLVFTLVHSAPGSLITNLVGTRNVSDATIAAITEQYRLDDPLAVQYLHWLGNLLTGDLGQSIRFQQPVADVIGARVASTASLASLALALAVLTCVPLGVWTARRQGRFADRAVNTAAIIGISAPAFALSLLLLYVFAFRLGWFPLYGEGSGILDRLWHLVLPATALAAGVGASILKITRTAIVRELESDHVRFARARGIGERRITQILVRNAAIPILTSSGLVLAGFVGGAILIETVFAIPGLGLLLYDAVIYQDVPLIQSLTLGIAAVIIIVNLLIDLSYPLLDRRLRVEAPTVARPGGPSIPQPTQTQQREHNADAH